MFVSKDFPWLSATPDGMVGQALLEIKCPNTNDCKQLAKGGTYDVRHNEKDGYFITQNGPRGFYSQVQFQLFCTGRQVCFFYVWSLDADILMKIPFDEDYVSNRMARLHRFYFSELLPRLEELYQRGQLQITNEYKEICQL